MSVTISIAKVKLVRESSHRYDITSKRVSSPETAADAINAALDLKDEAQEVLGTLFLDTKNHITGVMEVTRGTLCASLSHPREIFKGAILHNAASIILFHNHPSGHVNPSHEDLMETERIVKCGQILDIPLLDHIIIGYNGHYSLKEHDQI